MSAAVVIRGMLVLAALAACARQVPPAATPAPAPPAGDQHAAHAAAPATAPAFAATTAQLSEGKRLFETVCSTCHTVKPPPAKAPPMSHVAMRYRNMAGGDSAAIARIAAFVAAPSAERSLMPAMARERFGLMPPLPLPADQLRAAAAYVLTLADSAGMQGHGRHGR